MTIAPSAAQFAGGIPIRPFGPPLGPIHPIGPPLWPIRPVGPPIPRPPESLPVAGSRNGNLFADRNDTNLHWYLPDLELAADIDPSFAFVASQSGQQANNQPYNVALMTLRISKLQPAQVTQFAQSNPSATIREIPLHGLAAFLSSYYFDQNGNQQARNFNASNVKDQGDGSFLLTFDGSILGDSVLALYQDLTFFGKATITLNASFGAWSPGVTLPTDLHRVVVGVLRTEVPDEPVISDLSVEPRESVPITGVIQVVRPVPPVIIGRPIPPPGPPPGLVQVNLPFSTSLPLNLKYKADGYQMRYTVSTSTIATHVILGASDLNSFNQVQTQYAELKALGDINLKYPTLSRAYFGVLSRTVVLIPQRYSIVRGTTSCAATCTARVDTSPSSSSQCAFEFSFTVAPEVSRIDLSKLQQDIAAHPDFKDYQLTFPDFLGNNPSSTLLTSFQSNLQFAAGADAHTFAITATLQDQGPNTPAVANANLFVVRLAAQTGTDLIGSLSIKLDDGFLDPVLATIDLNFQHTAGGPSELLATLDEAGNAIELTSQSSFNLQLQDYALIQNSILTEFPGLVSIAAGAKVSLPLPANHAGMEFVPVAQLLLPVPMSASAVAQYLTFQTVNVQQTQYVVAVDASGVDYGKVASIAFAIVFPNLPSLAPLQFTLTANLRADSQHIQIPIEDAVLSLPGTISATVSYVDPTQNPVPFTLENDFTTNPVFVLLQSVIDSQLAKTVQN